MRDGLVVSIDAVVERWPIDSEHLTKAGRGDQLPATDLDGWDVAGACRIVGGAARDAEEVADVLDTHGGLDCRVGDRGSRLEVLSAWH